MLEPNSPVWAWFASEWRPAKVVRYLSRGKRKGWALVELGWQCKKRAVPPQALRLRKSNPQ